MRCRKVKMPPRRARGPEGQRGTDGRPGPRCPKELRRSHPDPVVPTLAPRTGPTRARRLEGLSRPYSKGTAWKRAAGGRGERGRRRPPQRKLRPHARGPCSSPAPRQPAPPSHSPVPGPARPAQPRRSSEAAAAQEPERGRRGGAPLPAGARRRAAPLWPSRSRALREAGPTPSPRALRPARQAPGPGRAAALTASLRACAAHLKGPPGGRGGDEVRVGAGDRAAWPRRTPGLGGTTRLQPRGWPDGPRPLQAAPRRGRSLPGGGPPLPKRASDSTL
ncbi:uncharacterized protein LOC105063313 [Camelus bactrianus]|uniref:Uncharacterized protein LOC105063313 n=1 Tax=Camelus bactrianus TaxID=9837 RepID=A0AC58QYP8_CAMBA